MNELSPELKKLLQAARESYSPNETRVASVREAVGARIATPAGAESAGPAATSAPIASGAAWAKPIAVALIAALGAGGVWLGTQPSQPHPQAHPQRPSAAPAAPAPDPAAALEPEVDEPAAALEPEVAREPAATPRARGRDVGALASRRRTAPPRSAGAMPTNDAPSARTPAAAQVGAGRHLEPRAVSPSVSGSAPALRGGASSAADEPRAAPDDPGAQPAEEPARAEQPVAVVDDPLVDELALLRRARAALAREQPAEALELSRQHARRFPRGTLRQERLATQVLALCGMQRPEEARVLARELERVAPRSPHLMRLRASCVTQGALSGEQ